MCYFCNFYWWRNPLYQKRERATDLLWVEDDLLHAGFELTMAVMTELWYSDIFIFADTNVCELTKTFFFSRYLISRVCQKSTKLYVYTCWHKPNKDPLGLWLTSAKHIMVSMTTVNQWEWLKYSVLPSATSRLSLSKLDPYLFIVTAKPAKA